MRMLRYYRELWYTLEPYFSLNSIVAPRNVLDFIRNNDGSEMNLTVTLWYLFTELYSFLNSSNEKVEWHFN